MGEHKDDQAKPMQGPGQNQPATRPDNPNQNPDKDRKASDEDEMKKHSPSPNNPNNPKR
jgi:hypothetical protein